VSRLSIFQIFIYSVFYSWEYPGKPGIGCNIVSPNDSANFLSFLQTLRANGAQNLTVSAAVSITPFIGSDGNPMSDVSAFAEVLDSIGSPSPTFLFRLSHLCLTLSLRDYELRYLGILEFHRRTKRSFRRFMRSISTRFRHVSRKSLD
jgi:hypothetical protein